MKKFGLNIIFFALPLLIISSLGDFLISKTLKKSNHKYYVVWNDLVSGNVNSQIVVYGTSRARAHINSKILEDSLQMSTYNLGIDGFTFDMEYCRHKLLLENNPKPAYIIQTLDFHMLGKTRDLYQFDQFCPYFDNEIVVNTIKSYNGPNLWDFNLPLVRYYGRSKEIVSAVKIILRPSSNKGNRYKGFYNYDRTWTDDFENAKDTNGALFQKLDKSLVILFEKYLVEVKNMGIPMIFVYTPEHIDGQNFVSNRKEIMTLYKNLALKHHIPFIDYSSDPMCFNKEYFYNAEHLNLKGSNLFTNKLATDLKKYIKISE